MAGLASISLALLCVALAIHQGSSTTDREEAGLYVNEWAVRVAGGETVARDVALEHGFEFDGQIGSLPNTYALLKRYTVRERSRRAAGDVTQLLAVDKRVLWAEQQTLIYHSKKARDVVRPDETGDSWAIPFNDPLFEKQWYLYNDGQQGATPGMDMNLMPAWKLGYTGKGIVVTIVDDGMDEEHPDLKDNFDPLASYDFNDRSKGHSPMPDYTKPLHQIRHGTRCAGEVAAAANNSICGIGVAYEASIGGIRLLDGSVTDRLTSDAIMFNNHHVDIYSCCWGPVDDGVRFDKPLTLTKEALAEGAKNGRNGKGSIFVWAAGNGGNDDDHCGADGYVGNIHTIAISAINDHGQSSYFDESCPAIMAVTLSGGPNMVEEMWDGSFKWNLVTTTDLNETCTSSFVGTSSAAPLASGLFAVILQANPQLTWRDLQYIIAQGCNIPQPYDAGWHINGAGLHVHHHFGFGVLDGGKMVQLALKWDLVGPQRVCRLDTVFPELAVRQGQSRNLTLDASCPGIRSLEHVEVTVNLQAERRGDISFILYSPSGTPSRLLDTRIRDSSTMGLEDWTFMTVHNWGEDPTGQWTLQFSYSPTPEDAEQPEDAPLELLPRLQPNTATLESCQLTLYGTKEPMRVPDLDEEEPEEHKEEKNKKKDGAGEGEDEDEDEEENPAVNPDDAGKSDQNTIIDIYNQEQLADEEIHIHPGDIAEGVAMPPNAAHNLNKNTGAISTDVFDGHLLSRYGLVRLYGVAKRLADGDPLMKFLVTLDDRDLEMLGRDFKLDDVMERMMRREEQEEKGKEEEKEIEDGEKQEEEEEEEEEVEEKKIEVQKKGNMDLQELLGGRAVSQRKVNVFEEELKEEVVESAGKARGVAANEHTRHDDSLESFKVSRSQEFTPTEILRILRTVDDETLLYLVKELELLDRDR